MQPFDTIRAQILARRAIFARQGSVVATWRTRGCRRCGPYYRVAYREAGRQKSLYLGPSAPLADQVRGLLAELQQPLRYGRLLDRLAAQARASLRQANAELNRVLGSIGYYLKGHHEFRRLPCGSAGASPSQEASSARLRMVDAWVHRAQSEFRVEKTRLVDQQEQSEQAAVGSEQKCRSGPSAVKCKSERKCRETPHRRLGASSCPPFSCLPSLKPCRRKTFDPRRGPTSLPSAKGRAKMAAGNSSLGSANCEARSGKWPARAGTPTVRSSAFRRLGRRRTRPAGPFRLGGSLALPTEH
jgi:hypothetical protein